jgi:hypothetical protein
LIDEFVDCGEAEFLDFFFEIFASEELAESLFPWQDEFAHLREGDGFVVHYCSETVEHVLSDCGSC